MLKQVLYIILLIFISRFNDFASTDDNRHTGHFYQVTRIVDGDTFWVDDGSVKGLKIRLIGIDAPESRNSGNKKKSVYGSLSAGYLSKLIKGKKVRLEYDIGMYDRYGRTLAYAYLENGTFINASMVKNGYASVMTVPPNVKFSDLFLKLAAEARNQKKGIWKKEVR